MTNALNELSEALVAAVKSAGPSVVRVDARRHLGGSGVVWSEDGVIAAADHAIEREDEIEVGLADGKSVPAKLIGRDPGLDLAVLKVDATGLAAPAWAQAEAVEVGQILLALSRPGRSVRASLGIASVVGTESWRTPAGGRLDRYVQADVSLSPGFSGGLIVDGLGLGVGLATSGILRRTPLAVPGSTLARAIGELLAHGRPRRGFLGIGAHPVRLPPEVAAARGGQDTGLIVVAVQPGAAAHQAGILIGDVILAVEGQPIRDLGELHERLDPTLIGKAVEVAILRAGQTSSVRPTIGAR